jgi:glycosyltransferase involved in cell wall biosynthesis
VRTQNRNSNGDTTVCIVVPYLPSLSETFIRAHVEGLPATVELIHGWRPALNDRPVLGLPWRILYKGSRMLFGDDLQRELTAAYSKAFRRSNASAVLAEYGTTGVLVAPACREAQIPLIVHFHGYDASVRSVLEEHRVTYPMMFEAAAAIIAVSRAMQHKLIALGAPPEKVHYNPYGVDCHRFSGADPAKAPPLLLAVGRFTEKKAPQLTLAAFADVHRLQRHAKLVMIGEGPLLEECRVLAERLHIGAAVSFLGAQSHDTIQRQMSQARGFVQHSVEAPSGDCEGTPLAILEAGATGLPVVSTRHAGIPDVVIEEETGFLVDEGDVDSMARCMLLLVEDSELAGRMGRAAQERIQLHFSKQRSLEQLWRIIETCVEERSRDARSANSDMLNTSNSGA